MWDYLKDMIYLNLIFENRYVFLIKGFEMTLLLTISTFLLGTVLGVVICAGVMSKKKWLSKIFSLLKVGLTRLPTLVLLMVFVYLLFSDLNVDTVILAIFALSMKTAAYMSEFFKTAVESVDKGEVEAARTLGMSKVQAFKMIVLPQATQQVLPLYKNQLILCMQESSLVGFLAITDITRASQVISSRTLDPYISLIITAVAYLVVGAVSSLIFSIFEKQHHLDYRDFYVKEGESK